MIKKTIKKISPKNFERVVKIRDTVRDIRRTLVRVEERLNKADSRLDQLRYVHSQADPYQPIYGITGIGEGQRDTRDRCEAIFDYFGNNVRGLRILDVGCFFGYLSFYLADRGAHVEGWDNNSINIEVCNGIKDITGVPVDFKLKAFSPETIESVEQGQYDVVFILSVLHWLVALYGLEYVQDCMKSLMDKVPVLIVELAQKGENKKLFWDKAVPQNDLDIFAKVEGLKIEKITDFQTHLSGKKRPLYRVTKEHVTINNHNYAVNSLRNRAYPKAPIWRPIAATYFEGPGVFIKQYNYGELLDETKRYVLNEVNFFLQNGSEHNKTSIPGVPLLKDFEIESTKTSLVFERIEGELLSENAAAFAKNSQTKITRQLLKILAAIERRGLHHNDLRSWNVMIGKQDEVYLIDFELVSTVEHENNIVAFFWVLNTLLTGESESHERNKTLLPDRSSFRQNNLAESLFDYYTTHSKTTFSALLAVAEPKKQPSKQSAHKTKNTPKKAQ